MQIFCLGLHNSLQLCMFIPEELTARIFALRSYVERTGCLYSGNEAATAPFLGFFSSMEVNLGRFFRIKV